ncbi:hypothetical protein JOF53_005755 [Crossiella equi]|uniref:Zinc ribbon domain-containing protein n=1 Tax=Crossiella equi TaxID=130796 RepID=A0ABS5AJY8_9PSEU|nr:hypothetical protein [Crossiella equi]MBP2476883.1 hypothetical protein [Crossiella equi]
MNLAGVVAADPELAGAKARPECPVSPDGRHCQSATGAPYCQFCGAPM